MFASCLEDTYHPLGKITKEEWESEEERIAMVDDNGQQKAQAATLKEIKHLRDEALRRYQAKPPKHRIDAAILDVEKLLKAYGVSMPKFHCLSHDKHGCVIISPHPVAAWHGSMANVDDVNSLLTYNLRVNAFICVCKASMPLP